MSAQKLYTPQLLALAVDLSRWLPDADCRYHGESRSRSCGSSLALDLDLDAAGLVAKIGMKVRACAVGQAAAAIFAHHAAGLSPAQLEQAGQSIERWLQQSGDLPDWPQLSLIAPARDFPGRHGAILLPWKAAMAALSSSAMAG